MNNEFASFESTPPEDINLEQIEEIAIVGEQHDDTPRETYQERGAKAEAAAGSQPVTENLEVPDLTEAEAEPSAEKHQQAILNEILRAQEAISPEPQSTNAENQNGLIGKIKEVINKAKKSRVFEFFVTGILIVSISFSLAACNGNQVANNNQEPTTAYEQTTAAGEQENGLEFDYSGFQSSEKLHKNNFGEDLTKYHGDRDAMIGKLMEEAKVNPEMLVAESYHILTDSQKKEIGIDGMTISEIDESLNGKNGGELQQKMYEKLNSVMNDKEHTKITWIISNGRVWTDTEFYIDENKDGKQEPLETYNGTIETFRNNVKQFKVDNNPSEDDRKISIVNENCKGQVDTKEKPEGVPEVGLDEKVETHETIEETTKPTPETTTEWGKSGDPHGGENVTRSPQVDPNSQKSKEENDNTNKGNQGSSNTKPGSSSNNTNSNNKPTNPNRKSGGENQGGSSTNGNNSAPKGDESREQSGNNSQRQAQEQNQPGGNNNTDSEEEQRVADGDF